MVKRNLHNAPYVRKEMLEPEAPPASQQGAAGWLRENLFSSPLNVALTLIAVAIILWLIGNTLPWFLNGVWHANSLSECREIIAANAGEGAGGACWAIVRARWYQFLFGFYPPALFWRAILAFALMLTALVPVLFIGQRQRGLWMVAAIAAFLLLTLPFVGIPAIAALVTVLLFAGLLALQYRDPGKLVVLTALYPFLCFWLLWGGSIWRPLVALAGFGVLALVYRLLHARLGVVVATGLGFVAACLWWLLAQGALVGALHSLLPWGIVGVDSDRFGGFLLAITIGITAISFSLPLGVLLALGRRSDMPLIKLLSVGFIEFIRGVPLITLLFTASLLLKYFLPPGTNFDSILRVIIMVTLFSAAYLAEVIRGGLAALPRGQYEAADALGLDYWKAQRLIIMPQALKIAIPGIVSTFIGLFKDTTLVTFVGLYDPLKGITGAVRADIAWKGVYWEPYIFVGAIFFIICFGMSRYSMSLERRLKTDHR